MAHPRRATAVVGPCALSSRFPLLFPSVSATNSIQGSPLFFAACEAALVLGR